MTYFLCDCHVADSRSGAAKHSRVFHFKKKKGVRTADGEFYGEIGENFYGEIPTFLSISIRGNSGCFPKSDFGIRRKKERNHNKSGRRSANEGMRRSNTQICHNGCTKLYE